MKNKIEDGILSFGQLMVQLRKGHKKSQEWVAQKMGIHADKLRQYEKDSRELDRKDFDKFIKIGFLREDERERLVSLFKSTIDGERGKHEMFPDLTIFSLGDQEIPDFRIIDGVGDVPAENIKIEIDESPAEIPPRLRFFYNKYVQGIEQRERREPQTPFDGDILGVKAVMYTRIANTEQYRWSLTRLSGFDLRFKFFHFVTYEY